MPKQFAKDVPRMVRVDGRRPGGEGASADERVAAAARAVQEACGRLKGAEGTRALGRNAGEVMALATQGLGIALYEATLERYKRQDPSVAVMQAGHHYIDLETGAGAGGAGRGPAVTVVAYFKLHKADDLAVPPWLLQASLRVDIAAGEMLAECSLPVKAAPGAIEALGAEEFDEGRD